MLLYTSARQFFETAKVSKGAIKLVWYKTRVKLGPETSGPTTYFGNGPIPREETSPNAETVVCLTLLTHLPPLRQDFPIA
jgi:hypothetical protein